MGSFSLSSIGGSYVGGATPTAATATGLDFGLAGGTTGNGYGTNGTAIVGNVTGSFLGLNGVTASVADIALGATTANPFTANPFISFGGASAITVNFSNAPFTRSLGTSVIVTGTATFTDGVAADATTGTFSLSTSSQFGSASSANFTFTSNASANAPTVVPEPFSIVLLGTGLVGLGIARKKRQAA